MTGGAEVVRGLAELRDQLRRIDGRPYPAYRDLRGVWSLDGYDLHVDHVQGDPYAAPSRVRLRVPLEVPDALRGDRVRRMAAEDHLLRQALSAVVRRDRGSGRSGAVELYRPGPEVVERSACRVDRHGVVELRLAVGLPARGRRVLGRQAFELLTEDLGALVAGLEVSDALRAHVDSVERQAALRAALGAAGLVGFVEDGAVLPRASGVATGPLEGAVPFASPPSLRVTLCTPFGPASGMGIRPGVTLITGGGFHGKSTVLAALERGHLDHVPGDGREGVVTVPQAAKVRAEDGRAVWDVDIGPFLSDLPGDLDPRRFSTEDASGSTSQAAALVEAVEAGASLLLIDEDTSATNLMVRDARMRALIPREGEPITPLVERVRQLHETWGVSTVMVVGGVGDFLAVADTVVRMDQWRASDVTEQAHAVAGERPAPPGPLGAVSLRVPVAPPGERGKVRARDRRGVRVQGEELDLVGVAGILDAAHARTVGHVLRFVVEEGLADGARSLPSLLRALDAILDDEGVEVVGPWSEPVGDLVRPRMLEVAAAWSRSRRWRSSTG